MYSLFRPMKDAPASSCRRPDSWCAKLIRMSTELRHSLIKDYRLTFAYFLAAHNDVLVPKLSYLCLHVFPGCSAPLRLHAIGLIKLQCWIFLFMPLICMHCYFYFWLHVYIVHCSSLLVSQVWNIVRNWEHKNHYPAASETWIALSHIPVKIYIGSLLVSIITTMSHEQFKLVSYRHDNFHLCTGYSRGGGVSVTFDLSTSYLRSLGLEISQWWWWRQRHSYLLKLNHVWYFRVHLPISYKILLRIQFLQNVDLYIHTSLAPPSFSISHEKSWHHKDRTRLHTCKVSNKNG